MNNTIQYNTIFRLQCVTVVYEECKEVPVEKDCDSVALQVPFQPKIHRVKCLLPTDFSEPPISVEKSAEESEAILEAIAREAEQSQDVDLRGGRLLDNEAA